MRRLLAVFVLVGLWGAAPAGAATPVPIHHALLVGDSIGWEASSPMATRLAPAKWGLTNAARPTTAPCDWLAKLPDELTTHPEVVVVESVGNSYSPCMYDPTTGKPWPFMSTGYQARYQTDLAAIYAQVRAAGAIPVFVEGPPILDTGWNAATMWVAQLSGQLGVPAVLAPHNSVSAAGKFTWTKPCLRGETAALGCTAGVIVVRAPDGTHFCPTGPNFYGCPVYSSGAKRYGTAMGAAAIRAYNLSL